MVLKHLWHSKTQKKPGIGCYFSIRFLVFERLYNSINLYFPAPKPLTFSITPAAFIAFITFVAFDLEHDNHSITFVCPKTFSVPHSTNISFIFFINFSVISAFRNKGKYSSKALLTFSASLPIFSKSLLTFRNRVTLKPSPNSYSVPPFLTLLIFLCQPVCSSH